MSYRVVQVPVMVGSCECGSKMVEHRADGISERYNCLDCGILLADLIIGAEP